MILIAIKTTLPKRKIINEINNLNFEIEEGNVDPSDPKRYYQIFNLIKGASRRDIWKFFRRKMKVCKTKTKFFIFYFYSNKI